MPPLRLHPLCRRCGYELSGLAVDASTGVCPECGNTFDPRRPWLWPPWPRLWLIALRLISPVLIALPILWLIIRSGAIAPSVTRLVIVVMVFIAVTAGAVLVVTGLTDRHLPMPRGMWVKGGLLLLSLAINLGGLVLGLALI